MKISETSQYIYSTWIFRIFPAVEKAVERVWLEGNGTKSSEAPGRFHHRFLPAAIAAQRGYAVYCWRVKVERSNVLKCAYITDTRSLAAEGAPAAENYNLNGRRPFPPCAFISLFSSKHLIFMRHSNSASLLFELGPRSRDTTRRCHFAKLFAAPPFLRRCIRENAVTKSSFSNREIGRK